MIYFTYNRTQPVPAEAIVEDLLHLLATAYGPGCVKMALYLHGAQSTASIRIAERKCSWNPFSERP